MLSVHVFSFLFLAKESPRLISAFLFSCQLSPLGKTNVFWITNDWLAAKMQQIALLKLICTRVIAAWLMQGLLRHQCHLSPSSFSFSLFSAWCLLGVWRSLSLSPLIYPHPTSASSASLNKRSALWDFKKGSQGRSHWQLHLSLGKDALKSCSSWTPPARTDHPYMLMIECMLMCVRVRVKDLTSRKGNGCKRNLRWREVTWGGDRKIRVGRPNLFSVECPSAM